MKKTLRRHTIKINQLKKKNSFKQEFNLLGEIHHLPTEIDLMAVLPRPSQIKDELEKIKKATVTLQTVLQNTSTQTKVTLNQIPHFLTDIVKYKDIRHSNNEWNIALLEDYLTILSQTCDYALPQTPKDRGGSKKRSIPKYVIFKLASIFEQGTGEKPKSGWHDESQEYIGKFYKFLIDITPILNDLNIEMVCKDSLGRYNADIIRFYKQALREYE